MNKRWANWVRTRQWSRKDLWRALWGLLVIVFFAIAVERFLTPAWSRIRYPYALEWMESGIVEHIRVALSGKPIYQEPSIQFTAFIYPPVYYYISALFTTILGTGFLAPRLVSALSLMGSLYLMGWMVWRQTRDWTAGVAAAGLFVATYGMTGYWFDVARVDSLFLFLILSGYGLTLYKNSTASKLAAAVLFALAFFTKQSGLVMALPAIAYLWLHDRKTALKASVLYGLLLLIGIKSLDVWSQGWFSYYIFKVPASHQILWPEWKDKLQEAFLGRTLILVLWAALSLATFSWWKDNRRWFFFVGAFGAAGVSSYLSLLHTGGYPNVLMPAYAVFAVLAAISLGHIRSLCQEGFLGTQIRVYLACVLFLQLWLVPFSAKEIIPKRRAREASAKVLARIADEPGPYLMMNAGFSPWMLGQAEWTTHGMGPIDVFKTQDAVVKDKLLAQMRAAIAQKRYRTIVLSRCDAWLPGEISDAIHRAYHLKERLISDEIRPVVGADCRPNEIWSATP